MKPLSDHLRDVLNTGREAGMTDAELDPLRRLRHALETAEHNGSLPGDAEKAVDRMSELLRRWEEEPPPQTPLPLPSFDED